MAETTLIPMLGSNQVDEFVLYPQTTIEDVSSTNVANGASAHTAPQPASQARIERILDDVELNHSRDREDDIYTVHGGKGLPGDMIVWYLFDGEDNDSVRILATVTLSVPQEKGGHALLLANAYNEQSTVGKAFLRIKEDEPDAQLYFESVADMSDGVTDSTLQRFIILSLYAAHVFFEKSGMEKVFIAPRPKKHRHTTKEVTRT
jgi:hypothetical protein